MTSILFVCTANRFRSPLAEALFRFELERSGQSALCKAGSAGTWTENGLPAMPAAITIGVELGLDLTTHRSRLVSDNLLNNNSLILVMQSGHKEALSVEFPDHMDKVFLLSDVVGNITYDIRDPFVTGEPPQEIAREIADVIQAGWMKIFKLAIQLGSKGTSNENRAAN